MKRYIVCINNIYEDDMVMHDVKADDEVQAILKTTGDCKDNLELENINLDNLLKYYSDGDLLISIPYEIK